MQFVDLREVVGGKKYLLFLAFTGMALAQIDPGPRTGPAGAGGALAGLAAQEVAVFNAARGVFLEIDSVSGTLPGEEGKGLGPTFNANSCAGCHAQPAAGGTSPAVNPQVALAKLDHPDPDPFPQTVPSFIKINGPVREARFVQNPDGSLDGGVHGLYTIAGRTDAPGCTLAQPDFATQLANRNVIFRIPTPTFGLGLVENTPDAALKANLDSTAAARAAVGIRGRLNTSGNDGTVTRFGWKAQNKSLLIFAGEAYNVEQGVANELFMNERSAVPGCVFNATPEDRSDTTHADGSTTEMSGDAVNFALFMRLSAPPTPTTASASELNGQTLFSSVGCSLCHSPTLVTAASPYTGASNVTYHPYSDFAIHHMGSTLADGIKQGGAGPDEFRTAPLWGVGQRLFFLHDGRTSNLLEAIKAHTSPPFNCVVSASSDIFEFSDPSLKVFAPSSASTFCGSEADKVIAKFNALNSSQKQDILNFLRSL